jgi:hypothetical protein
MKRLYLLFFLGVMMIGPDTRAADPRAPTRKTSRFGRSSSSSVSSTIRLDWRRHARVGVPIRLLTFGVAALYLGLRLRPGA